MWTQVGHVGSLQQRLESFGDLLRLVAGQYGEVSQDLHDLLNRLAESKAAQTSQIEGDHYLTRKKASSYTNLEEDCLPQSSRYNLHAY